MLVDFMIIGAQKSGTTSLASQLSNHPEICFCNIKEPMYFLDAVNWRKNLNSYHQLFTPQNGQLLGEASTTYTFLPKYPDTYKSLYEYNPDLKLVYIMRHPIERMVSNYTHRILRNQVKLAPEEALLHDPSFINISRYGVQIQPYIELFGRDNILLLVFEEYVADPLECLKQIAGFLQIDFTPFKTIDTKPKQVSVGNMQLKYTAVRKLYQMNAFQSVRDYIPQSLRQLVRKQVSKEIDQKPTISLETRKLLWRFVEDDVCHIEQLMQRELTIWRTNI
ncbi:MAG: sulfotransferase domain-containing protein [Chloroflexi bacterium]|nr:sulfotransferase domain-containing protein [Chloroflexota bacterium]